MSLFTCSHSHKEKKYIPLVPAFISHISSVSKTMAFTIVFLNRPTNQITNDELATIAQSVACPMRTPEPGPVERQEKSKIAGPKSSLSRTRIIDGGTAVAQPAEAQNGNDGTITIFAIEVHIIIMLTPRTYRPRSRAIGSVKPTSAPFDAEYAHCPCWPS